MSTVWLNELSSANLLRKTYINGFLDISGGDMNVRSGNFFTGGLITQNTDSANITAPSYSMFSVTDLSYMFASITQPMTTFAQDITTNGNTIVKKNLFVINDASLSGKFTLFGDASLNSKLSVASDASLNSRLFLGGDASLNSKLSVAGDVSMNGKLFLNGDASMNSKLSVGGDVSMNGKLFLGGDASMNSRLFLRGDASMNSRLFLGGDASMNSNLFLNGDLSMNGNLKLKNNVYCYTNNFTLYSSNVTEGNESVYFNISSYGGSPQGFNIGVDGNLFNKRAVINSFTGGISVNPTPISIRLGGSEYMNIKRTGIDISGTVKLNTSNASNNKLLVLWDGNASDNVTTATNFNGFGINDFILRYQVPTTASNHIFYAGEKELMRIGGDGNVGIGKTTTGAALDVSGSALVSGNVSIGTSFNSHKLNIRSDTLSSVLGSTSNLASLFGSVNNTAYLNIYNYRYSTGSDWTQASTRIQNVIDIDNKAYIEFNPPGNSSDPGGIGIYTASTTGLVDNSGGITIKRNGNVAIGKTTANATLDISGTALVSGNVAIGKTTATTALDVSGTAFITSNVAIGTSTATESNAALAIKNKNLFTSQVGTSYTVEFMIELLGKNGGKWAIGMDQSTNANLTFFSLISTAFNQYGMVAMIENDTVTPTTAKMNFTGQHRCVYDETIDSINFEGLIVKSTGEYWSLINNFDNTSQIDHITIDESVPKITLTKTASCKSVFGVISYTEDTNNTRKFDGAGRFVSFWPNPLGEKQRVFVNALGEGGIWVCNENGIFENGDYITSSNIPGYGMVQETGQMMNYTVGKITMDCDFKPKNLPVIKIITNPDGTTQYINSSDSNGNVITKPAYKIRYLDSNGTIITENKYNEMISNGTKVYIAAFVGCIYHCG